MKIGIIVGSTRPGRNSKAVADWIYKLAENTCDFSREMNRLRTRDGHLPSQLSDCLSATCM